MNEAAKITGEWLFYLDGDLVYKGNNLITLAGLEYLAGLFCGEKSPDAPIYLGMGTGTTPPNLNNEKLMVEKFRKIISSKSYQNTMARSRVFLLPSEANGKWTEFGLYIGGSELANSGLLFNRIIPPGGITKANNQVLSVEIRVNFN